MPLFLSFGSVLFLYVVRYLFISLLSPVVLSFCMSLHIHGFLSFFMDLFIYVLLS